MGHISLQGGNRGSWDARASQSPSLARTLGGRMGTEASSGHWTQGCGSSGCKWLVTPALATAWDVLWGPVSVPRGPDSEQSWSWLGGAPGRTGGTYW